MTSVGPGERQAHGERDPRIRIGDVEVVGLIGGSGHVRKEAARQREIDGRAWALVVLNGGAGGRPGERHVERAHSA
jgi:hypothetical protein